MLAAPPLRIHEIHPWPTAKRVFLRQAHRAYQAPATRLRPERVRDRKVVNLVNREDKMLVTFDKDSSELIGRGRARVTSLALRAVRTAGLSESLSHNPNHT